MYISQLKIKNFRCFDDRDENIIEFNEGLNVIIGENNSGKTTILKALQLLFDVNSKDKLSIDDFNKSMNNFDNPPEIIIQATIKSSKSDRDVDKALVASWLIKLESPWEAQLTYQYFLPEDKTEEYKKEFAGIPQNDAYIATAHSKFEKYVDLYKAKIFGGNPDANLIAEREWLSRFDFQLLGPLRDAESEIYSGKNPLLKNFLKKSLKEYQNKKPIECSENQAQLKTISEKLVNELNQSEKFKSLKTFTKKTGASLNNDNLPKVKGLFEEEDIIDSLKLLISKTDFEIPITLNGLGYNNLLYISLILASFDEELANKKGSVYPILLIEEPEAHLHPSLQYNFMNYINKKCDKPKQIFISSHSTHITSAISLDNIICMSEKLNKVESIRPGKAFDENNPDDAKSKRYIERYLDATKSNLLFAKGVILVEGMTEQLLVPCLADYIKDSIIEESLTTILRIDGSCFKHFLKLFDSRRKNSLKNKKVSCILDTDPSKKLKSGGKYKSCCPFEINLDSNTYDYQKISPIITNLKSYFTLNENYIKDNICVCFKADGKTFEYDFVLENYKNKLLIVDSCTNKDNLSELFKLSNGKDGSFEDIIKEFSINTKTENKQKIYLPKENWIIDENKPVECFAYYYLHCVKDNKGEVAFDLEYQLCENLKFKNSEIPEEQSQYQEIKIPVHIKNAIEWACDRSS